MTCDCEAEDCPCNICVEFDGECQRGDDCLCKKDATAEPGW